MFEGMPGGGRQGDRSATPIPLAAPEVSADSDGAGQCGATPPWRERPPGPETMAALSAVSLQSCTDAEVLDVLAGWERAAAWVEAQRTRVLARTETRLLDTAVRDERALTGKVSWTAVHRQVETEVSAALGWTSRQTIARLDLARDLTGRLPAVLDAMNTGALSYRHAQLICRETHTLTDQQAQHLIERLLPEIGSRDTTWLRRRLRKACLQIDPHTANERAAAAVHERSVTIHPLDDGLAELHAVGPAPDVLAMYRVLNQTADRHTKDDPRTRTARRFDALTNRVLDRTHCHLPNHGAPGHGAPDPAWSADTARRDCPGPAKPTTLVQITMDLETLLGLREDPAELHGYGPLPANLARALAADAHWQRFIRDPVTGAPADLGRTRRHPDAELRRWIITRDQTCQFPTCYRPATHCEPDHNPAWDHGGGTNKDTLTSLCPKHHKVRHHGWRYVRHPDRITWTSPHQQIYQRYYTEADLISPPQACPHLDDTYHDTVSPPTDDDQQIDAFLPEHHPGQPLQDIPWDIVQAFGLDEQMSPWPIDENGNLVDEYVPSPEEEQAIIDAEDRYYYGHQPSQQDDIYGPSNPTHPKPRQKPPEPFPDEPPF